MTEQMKSEDLKSFYEDELGRYFIMGYSSGLMDGVGVLDATISGISDQKTMALLETIKEHLLLKANKVMEHSKSDISLC